MVLGEVSSRIFDPLFKRKCLVVEEICDDQSGHIKRSKIMLQTIKRHRKEIHEIYPSIFTTSNLGSTGLTSSTISAQSFSANSLPSFSSKNGGPLTSKLASIAQGEETRLTDQSYCG